MLLIIVITVLSLSKRIAKAWQHEIQTKKRVKSLKPIEMGVMLSLRTPDTLFSLLLLEGAHGDNMNYRINLAAKLRNINRSKSILYQLSVFSTQRPRYFVRGARNG